MTTLNEANEAAPAADSNFFDTLHITAAKLFLFSVVMFAFGYLMVPLYEKICEATGWNNLFQSSQVDADAYDSTTAAVRDLRTEFVTSASHDQQLTMTPARALLTMTTGKVYEMEYTLTNHTNAPIVGQAVPAYNPARAGQWFKKIQCFCFDQLHMEANETRTSKVIFVIDPAIDEEINTLALSYTFFKIEGAQ